QEAPIDGEPGHQQQAEPEDGNGDAELRQHGNQPAIPAIRLEGGKNAERQGDDDREAEAEPGERLTKDVPRSSRASLPRKARNCTSSGWSEPTWARAAAICCGVAPTPSRALAGSPGRRRSSTKSTIAAISS